MAPLHRLLVAVAMVLLLCGAAGVVTHGRAEAGSSSGGRPTGASGVPTTSIRAGSSPTSTMPITVVPTSTMPITVVPASTGAPGPSSAALEAGLITPTDMGGYYRVVPAAAASILSSSSCLAPLEGAPGQSGRALTGLLGPDERSVPTVVEEVASYPGAAARSRFQADVAAIRACGTWSFDFGGPTVALRLAPAAIPPVGDADSVWSGSFRTAGASYSAQVGLVLTSDEVVALVWIDSVPASDPVMGNFESTLSLAIGKLA